MRRRPPQDSRFTAQMRPQEFSVAGVQFGPELAAPVAS
jgi:hypothetical protein